MNTEPHAPEGRVPQAGRALRAFLCLCFAALPLSLASCQERAFGMPVDRLAEILAGRDPAAILALSVGELESRDSFGPEAWYYLARWIEDRTEAAGIAQGGPEGGAAKAASLYRLAYDKAGGMVRREAGRRLASALARSGAWEELLVFEREHRAAEGADWAVDRPILDAMRELGFDRGVLGAVAALREAFPAESGADADALLFLEGASMRRAGVSGWSVPFKALLLERPATEWSAKALEELEATAPPDPALRPEEYAAARMRVALLRRDYGAAYRAALPFMAALLSPSTSPAIVADTGKTFLYSGENREGRRLFAELEAVAAAQTARDADPAQAATARRVAWNALFYRARFALALELWLEAAELFGRASASAHSPADADAALWYGVDAAAKGAKAQAAAAIAKAGGAKAPASTVKAEEKKARRTAFEALAEASAAWNVPERFADLVDGLFREAVQARDWRLAYEAATRFAAKTSPAVTARLLYTAARALELGFYVPEKLKAKGGEAVAREARSRFLALALDPVVPLHYRALSAWRSGTPLALLPPALPEPAHPERLPEEEAFVLGFLDFGLADLAASEARSRVRSLDRDSIRRIAAALVPAGRADGSIRLAAALMERPDWDPRRADYEFLYPRPFLEDYRAIRPRPACPEQLLYGLLRSESLFRADIVSHAGAVGLSQLMPATAAEVARSLRLESFDLKSARDNLRIGAAFFSDLLDETDRPLRAMMAYNAGRGRLKKWKAEAGELPDDLMLEAIDIAETRQYGRNILAASVMYGELYYDRPAAETVRLAVEGGEF